MINSEKGKTEIKGYAGEILAEFSMIVMALKENGLPKEMLQKSFEIGFITPEEVQEKRNEVEREFENHIEKAIKDLFKI